MRKIYYICLFIFAIQVYAQDYKISFNSPLFTASSDSLIGNSNTTNNGIKKEFMLNFQNLSSTMSSTSLCNHADNVSKFNANSTVCSGGSNSDNIKLSIPLIVAYDLLQGYQIDVMAYSQNSPTIDNPLINIKIGNTQITGSGSLVAELSNIASPSSDIKSISYGGTDSDKSTNISFEIPFKGPQFYNERSSVIKIFTIIQSI